MNRAGKRLYYTTAKRPGEYVVLDNSGACSAVLCLPGSPARVPEAGTHFAGEGLWLLIR